MMVDYLHVLLSLVIAAASAKELPDSTKVTSVTFLVTVNDTWKWNPPIENDTCMVTIKTYRIYPDTPLNKSQNLMVGDCDNGPLVYSITTSGNKSSIYLTFHSSVINDASPPACTIEWDYKYRLPRNPLKPGTHVDQDEMESLLSGCSLGDSREGYHMTYYWFYILDWTFENEAKVSAAPVTQMKPTAIYGVSFLVAVNNTEKECLNTSKIDYLRPGRAYNKSDSIYVGKCDYGVLNFNITEEQDHDGTKHTYIDLIFYSHDIGDAAPPSCRISWDYTYQVPSDNNPSRSLLPGCSTALSREGHSWTYYWFYVSNWIYG